MEAFSPKQSQQDTFVSTRLQNCKCAIDVAQKCQCVCNDKQDHQCVHDVVQFCKRFPMYVGNVGKVGDVLKTLTIPKDIYTSCAWVGGTFFQLSQAEIKLE
jgi:hypothetical protein